MAQFHPTKAVEPKKMPNIVQLKSTTAQILIQLKRFGSVQGVFEFKLKSRSAKPILFTCLQMK